MEGLEHLRRGRIVVVFKGRRREYGLGPETGTTTVWETAGNPEDFSGTDAVQVADLGWRTVTEARAIAEDLEAPFKDLPYRGPRIL